MLNLTPLSEEKLEILASKIPEFQKVSFQNVNKVLHEIDETCPFSMPTWLLIMITMLWTVFVITLTGTIWHLKYSKATSKVRHFLTSHNRKGKVPSPAANHLQKQEKWSINISFSQLV